MCVWTCSRTCLLVYVHTVFCVCVRAHVHELACVCVCEVTVSVCMWFVHVYGCVCERLECLCMWSVCMFRFLFVSGLGC